MSTRHDASHRPDRTFFPGAGCSSLPDNLDPLLALLAALIWVASCVSTVPSRIYVVPNQGPALDHGSIDEALGVIDQIAQQNGLKRIRVPPQLGQVASHYATMVELARYERTDAQVDVVLLVGLDKKSGAMQVSLRDLRNSADVGYMRTISNSLISALGALPQARVEVRQ